MEKIYVDDSDILLLITFSILASQHLCRDNVHVELRIVIIHTKRITSFVFLREKQEK